MNTNNFSYTPLRLNLLPRAGLCTKLGAGAELPTRLAAWA